VRKPMDQLITTIK